MIMVLPVISMWWCDWEHELEELPSSVEPQSMDSSPILVSRFLFWWRLTQSKTRSSSGHFVEDFRRQWYVNHVQPHVLRQITQGTSHSHVRDNGKAVNLSSSKQEHSAIVPPNPSNLRIWVWPSNCHSPGSNPSIPASKTWTGMADP